MLLHGMRCAGRLAGWLQQASGGQRSAGAQRGSSARTFLAAALSLPSSEEPSSLEPPAFLFSPLSAAAPASSAALQTGREREGGDVLCVSKPQGVRHQCAWQQVRETKAKYSLLGVAVGKDQVSTESTAALAMMTHFSSSRALMWRRMTGKKMRPETTPMPTPTTVDTQPVMSLETVLFQVPFLLPVCSGGARAGHWWEAGVRHAWPGWRALCREQVCCGAMDSGVRQQPGALSARSAPG